MTNIKTQSNSVRLRELVTDFAEGRIVLPDFQRDYVWKPRQILNLLDSLLRGYPVSSFYVWRPPAGAIAKAKPGALNVPVANDFSGYLIDGQQRLTSLAAAFGAGGEDLLASEPVECYLDLIADDKEQARDTRVFVSPQKKSSIRHRVNKRDGTLINVKQFLGGMDHNLRKQVEADLQLRHDPMTVARAMERFDSATSILDHYAPVVTISEISDTDVIRVFSRLNKGGTGLRTGDIAAAELARTETSDVLSAIRQFVTKERPKRLGFGFGFALRTLVVVHTETAKFSSLKPDWITLKGTYGRTLLESWRVTERALESSLEFVDRDLGWANRRLVPSLNALVIAAFAFSHVDGKPGEEFLSALKKWLCLTAMYSTFSGPTESRMKGMLKAVNPGPSPVSNPAGALLEKLERAERAPLTADMFMRTTPPWGAGTAVMMAWLKARDARDWKTGEGLDEIARRGIQGAGGMLITVQHIFPRKELAKAGRPPADADRLANFALLVGSTNSSYNDEPPGDVYKKMSSEERMRAAKQMFNDDVKGYMDIDKYDLYCQHRAGMLADAINAWLDLSRVRRG